MAEQPDLKAYLERIGLAGSIAPTLATLQQIQALHVAAIPFENIDPLLGIDVRLDQATLDQKLLRDRRGGWCFEQNCLLLRVLRDLDFTVRPLAAHVLMGRSADVLAPLGHMLLLVDIDGMPYIADVGFGGLTQTTPIKLRADVEQETTNETFRVIAVDSEFRLEAKIGEAWLALHQFALTERSEDELIELNEQLQQPGATLTEMLAVARAEPGRRLTLRNTEFSVYVKGAEPERRSLTSLAELKETLTGQFRITLPATAALDRRLTALLPAEAVA
jgi:N-hydroxyarylamine O-acetyltransferase